MVLQVFLVVFYMFQFMETVLDLQVHQVVLVRQEVQDLLVQLVLMEHQVVQDQQDLAVAQEHQVALEALDLVEVQEHQVVPDQPVLLEQTLDRICRCSGGDSGLTHLGLFSRKLYRTHPKRSVVHPMLPPIAGLLDAPAANHAGHKPPSAALSSPVCGAGGGPFPDLCSIHDRSSQD